MQFYSAISNTLRHKLILQILTIKDQANTDIHQWDTDVMPWPHDIL